LTLLVVVCLGAAQAQRPQADDELANQPPALAEDYQLTPFTARYEVLRNGKKIGELNTRLQQHENGLWNYQLQSVATDWLIRLLDISTFELAWFDWRDGQLIPLSYRMESSEPGRDRHWQHRYRWLDRSTDTETYSGELSLPLVDNALDPLTLRIAVAARLDQGLQPAPAWAFSVLERDQLETQVIRMIGEQALQLGHLCFDTIQLYRFRREGSSRNYHAWHAPALHALPVRIRHQDDDDIIEMRLLDWSIHSQQPLTREQFECASA